MTKSGIENLKKELATLETTKRKQAKQRIKKARSFCDFREDPEYGNALQELAKIEERIATIEHSIQQAEIIEQPTNSAMIQFGNTVTYKEIPNGDIETYTIVEVEEADPLEGKISFKS